MRIAGIIAEYNPFHNGHAWHIGETRRRSGCVWRRCSTTAANLKPSFWTRTAWGIFTATQRSAHALRKRH